MRDQGLVACQPRPFRVTTDADAEAAAGMPDLVERDFTADRPGVKFVGDVTYVHTWQGFVYLATVIDCYSKKVVGWQIADHIRAQLVEDALRDAAATCEIEPRAIFHSDRGSRLYLGCLPGADRPTRDAFLDGTHGRVLGQFNGGKLLLRVEERARVPHRIRHQEPGSP